MRSAGWRRFPGEAKESDAGADAPKLSELRFRRLLQTERGEEQVTAFVRLVQLLGGKIDVARLADDFVFWNDRVKREWAFDYYAAGIAMPHNSLGEADETPADSTEEDE